jgi:hypothetical protein
MLIHLCRKRDLQHICLVSDNASKIRPEAFALLRNTQGSLLRLPGSTVGPVGDALALHLATAARGMGTRSALESSGCRGAPSDALADYSNPAGAH